MKKALTDRVRFGPFEIRVSSGELWEGERRIILQNQGWKLLLLLVASEGAIVTREEIQKELWPNDTMVEFDHSINAAIKKLRKALGDSAEEPRYVETAARRGYRLMVAVEKIATLNGDSSSTPGLIGKAESSVLREDPPSASLTGKTFSHYRVLDIIGGGGMGVVYRAEDLKLGRAVALKFLPEEMGGDIRALELFEREARAASALDHPNICSIYEFGEQEGQPFIVMQLLEGQTLRDRLFGVSPKSDGKSGLPFDLGQLLEVAVQIACGLEAAHEKGIIHRDIKPANIFLTHHGTVKILDFGIAKSQAGEKVPDPAAEPALRAAPEPIQKSDETALTLTHPGMAMGTAGYMSPEQIKGEPLDGRTDIYSLGLVLYEMVTAERAFGGPTTENSRESMPKDVPLPAYAARGECPLKLEEIVGKALEKDRTWRYQSVSIMRADLEKLKRETAGGSPSPPRRRSRRQIAAIAALAVTAALFFLWLMRPLEPLPEVVSIVPLTDSGTIPPNQTFVTDGPRLFFRDRVKGERILSFLNIDKPGERIRLGPFETTDIDDISPDGADLLIHNLIPDEGRRWIYPLFKGTPRPLPEMEHDGGWSPDGRLIRANGSSLFISAVDGRTEQKLLTVSGTPFCPRLSPDGRTLRFVVVGKTFDNAEIWEARSDGGNPHRAFPGMKAGSQWCGNWSHDGKQFFFDAAGNGLRTLWVHQEKCDWLHRLRPEPSRLMSGPIEFFRVVPSRSSDDLFAIGEKKQGQLKRFDGKTGEYVDFLDGISADYLAFSRDGRRVAYELFPQETLWRSRIDGTERVQLTFPPMRACCPFWSPDARKIVFSGIARPGEPRRLYATDANVSSPQALSQGDNREQENPAWDANSESVFFSSRLQNSPLQRSGIFSYDLRKQTIEEISESRSLYGPLPSPDGKWIGALREGSSEILLYNRASQKWQDLGVKGTYPSWSADSSYLYFNSSFSTMPHIKRIRIENRQIEDIAIADFAATGNYWAWTGTTPNGDALVLKDTSTRDIYEIELKNR